MHFSLCRCGPASWGQERGVGTPAARRVAAGCVFMPPKSVKCLQLILVATAHHCSEVEWFVIPHRPPSRHSRVSLSMPHSTRLRCRGRFRRMLQSLFDTGIGQWESRSRRSLGRLTTQSDVLRFVLPLLAARILLASGTRDSGFDLQLMTHTSAPT